MYKIAVIGDKDSILAFKAIGIEVFTAIDKDDAKDIQETIDKYREALTPAIILIPSNKGSLGIGLADINRSVEKAVGANILN